MLQLLKLRFVSQQIFSPLLKIFPILKRDAKLFLLRCSTKVIKYRNLEHERKAEPQNRDIILLYEYDNSKYFKKIKFYCLSNFVVWTLFGINLYDSYSKEPTLDDEMKQKWIASKKNHELLKKLIIAAVVLGIFLVLAVWFHFLRNIKRIEIMKSTKTVKFQTYSFFPSIREFSVPLKYVSGVISRHSAKGYIPIKVKNNLFYFMIDVKGHFPDPFLFDNSVGVKRDLKNIE